MAACCWDFSVVGFLLLVGNATNTELAWKQVWSWESFPCSLYLKSLATNKMQKGHLEFLLSCTRCEWFLGLSTPRRKFKSTKVLSAGATRLIVEVTFPTICIELLSAVILCRSDFSEWALAIRGLRNVLFCRARSTRDLRYGLLEESCSSPPEFSSMGKRWYWTSQNRCTVKKEGFIVLCLPFFCLSAKELY